MAGAKRVIVEHRSAGASLPAPYKPKARADVTLTDAMKLPSLKMGQKVSVTLHGRVTRISDEDYSKGFCMEVSSVEADRGMGGDLVALKSRRTMKAGTLDDDLVE